MAYGTSISKLKIIYFHPAHVGMIIVISLEHPLNAIAAIAVSPEGMAAVKASFKFELAIMQSEQLLQVIVLMLFSSCIKEVKAG